MEVVWKTELETQTWQNPLLVGLVSAGTGRESQQVDRKERGVGSALAADTEWLPLEHYPKDREFPRVCQAVRRSRGTSGGRRIPFDPDLGLGVCCGSALSRCPRSTSLLEHLVFLPISRP